MRLRLKELMDKSGITTTDLASLLGYQEATVRYWIRENRISSDVIIRITEKMNWTPNQLLGFK